MTPDGTLLESRLLEIPQMTSSMLKRSLGRNELYRFEATRLYDITYMSDGLRIKGFLALPPADEKKMPTLIFNRGGSGPKAALTATTASAYLCLYASWGYVAIASNYRGIGGSEGEEEWGGHDVNDAMNLLPLLTSFDYVDTNRLGLIGGSRGGMMALQMLARTNAFRAAVTFGAPTALRHLSSAAYIRKMMNKYVQSGANVEEEAGKRSAAEWASKLSKTTPLLVLHGTGDRRVDPEHAFQLGRELQKSLHPYKMILYDNADHVLAGRRRESNEDIRAWMDEYVKLRRPLPMVGPHGA